MHRPADDPPGDGRNTRPRQRRRDGTKSTNRASAWLCEALVVRLTPEELERGKTAKGGYTRKQLEAWGVPWPPPKGWKHVLLTGRPKVDPKWAHAELQRLTNELNSQALAIADRLLVEGPSAVQRLGPQMDRYAATKAEFDKLSPRGEGNSSAAPSTPNG